MRFAKVVGFMNCEMNAVKPSHQDAVVSTCVAPSSTSRFMPYEQRKTMMKRMTSVRFLFVLLKFQMRLQR